MMNVWDGNEGVYLEKESFRMPWDARRISIASETSEPRDPHKVDDAPSDKIRRADSSLHSNFTPNCNDFIIFWKLCATMR